MPSVRVIKKIDRGRPDSELASEVPANHRQLSTVVKSWVAEFHKEREDEPTAAFESLFNDSVAEAEES